MKTKSFQKYLEKRLHKDEIAQIEKQAKLEVKILTLIQQSISNAMEDYMEKNQVGFNELVRRLHSTPAHVAKMRQGKANLTIASLAHFLAAIGKEPRDIFKNKKS